MEAEVPGLKARGTPVRILGRWKASRLVAPVLIGLLLAIVGYVALDRLVLSKAAPSAVAVQTATVSRGTIAATINTTGSVATVNQAKLGFETAGILKELNVKVGTAVKKGDVLAREDTADLELQVAQAEVALKSAQLKLEELKAGPTPQDLASARASYENALLNLQKLKEKPTPADLASAEAAALNAQQSLQQAENGLATVKAGPTPEDIVIAKASVDKADMALRQAQTAYDRVAWRGDIEARPEALNLWSAKINYDQAVAQYNKTIAPPKEEDIRKAEVAVETASLNLVSAQQKLEETQAGATATDLRIAQLNVSSAKGKLDDLLKGPTEATIAAQEQQVKQAELTLAQRKRSLEAATIVAPYDGVVSAVMANAGERVSATFITLMDLNNLRFDANVDEADVAQLAVGQTAVITLQALSSTPLRAQISAIAPNATVQQGVATYLVQFAISRGGPSEMAGMGGAQQGGQTTGRALGRTQVGAAASSEPAIRVGMNGSAEIIVTQRDNVLYVPNRAVQRKGQNRVVEVMVNGQREAKTVTVGMSNDQSTEIVEGLQEGETVVIPGTTTAQPVVRTGGTIVGGGGFTGGGMPGGGFMAPAKKD